MSSRKGAKACTPGQQKALEAFEIHCKQNGLKFQICGDVGGRQKGPGSKESHHEIVAKVWQKGGSKRKHTFKVIGSQGHPLRVE